MISHKKKYGIYHWDTFDNETILTHEEDNFNDAVKWIETRYGNRLSPNGADRVEIVNKNGDILKKWAVC